MCVTSVTRMGDETYGYEETGTLRIYNCSNPRRGESNKY